MKLFKIKSVSQLVVAGFLLVAAPLIVALVQVGISIDRLAKQSERAVMQAVKGTYLSRILVEDSTAMERNARQFHVLGDFELYQAYRENHLKVLDTMEKLSELSLLPMQRDLLDQLLLHEKLIGEYLNNPDEFKVAPVLAEQFASLSELARSFQVNNNELIDKEVSTTQAVAERMQSTFYWQGVGLFPVALGLAIFFVILISRLVRDMNRSIRGLGDGDFSTPIYLKGPSDFEALGERLDWLRKRLSEVDAHKLKFLRHISHELKTPLTNIREGSELLADGVAGPLNDKQKEISQIIVDNGVQLQQLIEDLLRFGGAKDQKVTLKKSYFLLDDVVDEVLGKNQLALEAKQIEIEKTYKSPRILADREKIRVVVDNLISNACKYSPIGGVIRVATVNSPNYCMLGVTDDGPGIPKEERGRIFEAFYQASGEYVSHVKGTGLGLSIVKEYIDAHEGSVEVVEGKSGGAYFIVRIPRQYENEKESAA